MTREEAVYQINQLAVLSTDKEIPKITEALDMAIEALQREDDLLKSLETNEPIYDMVDVVRCKDCRWWNEDDFPRAFPEKKTSACECPNIYGANFSRYTDEDEFCSRGVRKGGDE